MTISSFSLAANFLYFFNNDCMEMTKTGMLKIPVRYCGRVVISPALKRSWKKNASTTRNPMMSMMSIVFLMCLDCLIFVRISAELVSDLSYCHFNILLAEFSKSMYKNSFFNLSDKDSYYIYSKPVRLVSFLKSVHDCVLASVQFFLDSVELVYYPARRPRNRIHLQIVVNPRLMPTLYRNHERYNANNQCRRIIQKPTQRICPSHE
jgi:hypothetical protein